MAFSRCPRFSQWQVVHCPGSDCDHMWLLPKQLRRSKASQEGAERLPVIPMGFQLGLSENVGLIFPIIGYIPNNYSHSIGIMDQQNHWV